jgi:YNFM family putative membrane transporter
MLASSFYYYTKTMKKISHYNRLIISVCLCSIATFSNIYWLQAVLPKLQESFGINLLATNLAMSSSWFGMGIGLVIIACWSDAKGRVPLLIKAMITGLCISLILPTVENYSLFLVLRFFQGACLAACPALAIPLLGEELRKSWLPAAVGFYIASNTIGGISSRLISGIGGDYLESWRVAGFIIAIISSLLFCVVFILLPKQRHFIKREFKIKESVKVFSTHLLSPELLIIYLISGLVFGCFMNQFSYLMTVLKGAPYYLPSSLRSIMFITFLGGTFSSSFAGKFSKKHGQIAGITSGVFIMLAANIMLSNQYLPLMMLGMIMMAAGFFFCHAQASTLVSRTVKKDKGSAMALYSLFYYSGGSLGVFYIDPFFQNWGWQGVLGATSMALMLCLGLITIYQIRSHHKQKTIFHHA